MYRMRRVTQARVRNTVQYDAIQARARLPRPGTADHDYYFVLHWWYSTLLVTRRVYQVSDTSGSVHERLSPMSGRSPIMPATPRGPRPPPNYAVPVPVPPGLSYAGSHTKVWAPGRCTRCSGRCWRVQDYVRQGAPGPTNTEDVNDIVCDACTRNPDRVKPCLICWENCVPITVRHAPCSSAHTFCGTCLAAHCETLVESEHSSIRCPTEGCDETLTDKELRLFAPGVVDKVHGLRKRGNLSWLRRFLDDNPSLLEWLATGEAEVQACPCCARLVQRAGGCSHMTCRCGGEFCWLCGETLPVCQHQGCSADGSRKPILQLDVAAFITERQQRRVSFCMTTHARLGADSLAGCLPADIVRNIAMIAVPALSTLE